MKQGGDFCSTGQYQKAIDNYQKALELKPDNYDILHKLGNTYTSLKEYQKAIEYYKKSTIINRITNGYGTVGVMHPWN